MPNPITPTLPPVTPPPVLPKGYAKPTDTTYAAYEASQGFPQTQNTNPNGPNYDASKITVNQNNGSITPNPSQQSANSNVAPNTVGGPAINPDGSKNPYAGTGTNGVSQTNVNPTGISTGNPNQDALAASYAAQAKDAETFSNAVTNIMNGTTPLTPGQQAQIDGLKQQYQQLIDTQNLVNTGASGTANIRGYQAGAAEYDPNFQAKTIGSVMTAGANKIASLQTQEASAVATLTQSLRDNDISMMKTAWDALKEARTATQDMLKNIVADTQAAIKDSAIQSVMASGITETGDILAKLRELGYNDISSSDIASTVKNLHPDAAAILSIQQDAAKNGASPEILSAMGKAANPAEALKIAAQGNVANSAVFDMMNKYPDAGIAPGDSVVDAYTKIQNSPSYTMDQKGKALDNAYKQAQIAKAYADAAKAASTVNDAGDTVQSLAQQLVDGTLAPSELSKRATGSASYNDVLVAAGKLMGTNGKPFNIAQADRDYKFANNVNTQNTLNSLVSLVGGPNKSGNMDELKAISDSIDRTDFPSLNDAAAWSKLETGNVDIARYKAVAIEVADQVAKILQGGSGGSGTSDAKLQQASDLFKTSFSKNQLNGIINSLKPLLANRAKSIISDNAYLKDYATDLGIANTSVASQIKDALAQNHPPGDIINYLLTSDSSVKDKILQAQQYNYSPEQILEQLQK